MKRKETFYETIVRSSRMGPMGKRFDRDEMLKLAEAMTAASGPDSASPAIPAGFTYLGQFVDCDWDVMHQAGAFFVTRAKSNLDARRVYSAAIDRSTGLMCDQTIALNGFYSKQGFCDHLRRIRFKDPQTGKTLIFLTNQMTLPALTICALYKSRWQVELFFWWQHLY